MTRRGLLGCLASAPLGVSQASAAGDTPPPLYSNVSQFILLRPTMAAPDRPIRTIGGSLIDLPALRGQVVVMNFWATWCIPCAVEMSSLDRLAARGDETGQAVLPIAMDQEGKTAVNAFYGRLGLRHLGVFVDPAQQVGHFGNADPRHVSFPLRALPTTYLVDPRGTVVGYVPGAARWDSPQALELIDWVAGH